MKNIFYGLGAKFKNRKARMGILTVMYALLFVAVILLMAFSRSISGQMNMIDRYIKNEVAVTYEGELGNAISLQAMETLASLECVEEYNGIYTGHTPGLKDKKVVSEFPGHELYRQAGKGEALRVKLVESNRTDNNLFFLYKGFKLVRGQHLLEGDRGGKSALISEEFARTNGLDVGDSFEIFNPMENVTDSWLGEAVNMKLQVKGIFRHPQTDHKTFQGNLLNYEGNFIFLTDLTIQSDHVMSPMMYSRVSVYLKEGRTLEDLRKQMEEARLDINNYALHSSSEWAQVLERPMEQMRMMSSILLGFVFVCILVSALLLSAFHLRQSFHELGVMLGMGVPWWKLLLQVLLEEYIPLFCGAALALLIGIHCLGGMSGAVDRLYTAKTQQIVEQRNEELYDESGVPGSEDFMVAGQVMQIQTDFAVDYTVDWDVFFWFAAAVCVLFPGCMGVQILYKIKCCTVRQVLLG